MTLTLSVINYPNAMELVALKSKLLIYETCLHYLNCMYLSIEYNETAQLRFAVELYFYKLIILMKLTS